MKKDKKGQGPVREPESFHFASLTALVIQMLRDMQGLQMAHERVRDG